jgi:hypothetical protein
VERRIEVLGAAHLELVDDVAPPTTRWAARGFLVWAISHRHCPRLKIPCYRGATAPALSRAQLVTTLRRLLDDDTIELGDRVAGLLVLLFAQPVAPESHRPPKPKGARDLLHPLGHMTPTGAPGEVGPSTHVLKFMGLHL